MLRTFLVLMVCFISSPAFPLASTPPAPPSTIDDKTILEADTPPAPPSKIDDKTVLEWIGDNLRTEGWTLISADEVAVTLGSPDGVEVLEKGLLRAKIRREYYGPDRLGPNDTRSNLQTWLVDCKSNTFGIAEMSVFKANNLSGGGESMSSKKVILNPPPSGSQNARALARICDAPKTGKPRS